MSSRCAWTRTKGRDLESGCCLGKLIEILAKINNRLPVQSPRYEFLLSLDLKSSVVLALALIWKERDELCSCTRASRTAPISCSVSYNIRRGPSKCQTFRLHNGRTIGKEGARDASASMDSQAKPCPGPRVTNRIDPSRQSVLRPRDLGLSWS